jgi:hypothetical protein
LAILQLKSAGKIPARIFSFAIKAAVPPFQRRCSGANVERAITLPEQRHAVKTIFLGIYTKIFANEKPRRWRVDEKSSQKTGAS